MSKAPSKKSGLPSKPDTTPPPGGPRTIRSYAKRGGRITAAQRDALATHWPRYGLDLLAGRAGFTGAWSDSRAPLILEIGFGDGESLCAQAQRESDRNFIGVEVYQSGIGRLLHRLAAAELDNVRVYHADVLDVLEQCVPDQCLERLQLYFPDPWPKKRHHKRRILQPDRMALFLSKLKPDGLMAMATDVADYAEAMQEVCAGFADSCRLEVCETRPTWRPETKFERRGVASGRRIFDFIVRPQHQDD